MIDKEIFRQPVPIIRDEKVRYVFAIGDLHGDYQTFKAMVDSYKSQRSDDSILVTLGDYSDRGDQGIEVVELLDEILDEQKYVLAIKGNHEAYNFQGETKTTPSDLPAEAERKRGSWQLYFQKRYRWFLIKLKPAIIANNVLFLHGGVASWISTVVDFANPQNESVILWSDPIEGEKGEGFNFQRREGVLFAQDVTEKVMSSLGVKLIIRSHHPRLAEYGPHESHGGRIVTINSCTRYGKPFMLRVDTIEGTYVPIYQDGQGIFNLDVGGYGGDMSRSRGIWDQR